jgi:hypothetical protein
MMIQFLLVVEQWMFEIQGWFGYKSLKFHAISNAKVA